MNDLDELEPITAQADQARVIAHKGHVILVLAKGKESGFVFHLPPAVAIDVGTALLNAGLKAISREDAMAHARGEPTGVEIQTADLTGRPVAGHA